MVRSASSPFMPTGKPPAMTAGSRRKAVKVPGMTMMPSTMLCPSRMNLNWNSVSRARMRWNQVTVSVLGSSIAPTQPMRGSRNHGTE